LHTYRQRELFKLEGYHPSGLNFNLKLNNQELWTSWYPPEKLQCYVKSRDIFSGSFLNSLNFGWSRLQKPWETADACLIFLCFDFGSWKGAQKGGDFCIPFACGNTLVSPWMCQAIDFFQETYVTYLDHSEITRFLVQKNKVSVGRASLRAPINSDPDARKRREVNRKSCRVEPIPKGVYSVNFEVVSRRVEFISREKD